MSSVIASNIPTSITIEKLNEFFSFCGKIRAINIIENNANFQKVEVKFESEKALSTALLLNDAELNGTQIKVEQLNSNDQSLPPAYSEVASGTGHLGDNKIQHSSSGDQDDDVMQEDKPKYAIMAQLLSHGYILSDKVVQKSIQLDKEKGYSSKFKSFLTSLDEKYIHSNEPESTANKSLAQAQGAVNDLQNSFQNSKYLSKLNDYMEKAANHPYGLKVHDFYKGFAKDVKDVHNEAKRLSELRTNNLSTDPTQQGISHPEASQQGSSETESKP